MNTLTIVTIIVCVGSLIYGFTRGIVKEAASLCSIILGVLACRLFGDAATELAARLFELDTDGSALSRYAASMIGNAALFCLVWLGVFIVSRLVRGAIHAIHLGIIDRLAGAVFCAAKWLLVFSLLLNLVYIIVPHAGMWGADPPEGFIKAILGYAPWLFGTLTAPGTAPAAPDAPAA